MKKIGLFLCLFIVSCSINDDNLSIKISKEIEYNKETNLSEMNGFDWDSMIVLPPYALLDKVAEEHQLDLSGVDKHISSSDEINVILFLKEKKAIKSCTLSRTLGDFKDTNKEIGKEHANFKVITDSLGKGLNQINLK